MVLDLEGIEFNFIQNPVFCFKVIWKSIRIYKMPPPLWISTSHLSLRDLIPIVSLLVKLHRYPLIEIFGVLLHRICHGDLKSHRLSILLIRADIYNILYCLYHEKHVLNRVYTMRNMYSNIIYSLL